MRRFVVFGVLLALLLGLTAPPRPTAAAAPIVKPESGEAGTRFTFLVDGFRSGEQLSFWLNSPAGAVIATEVEGQSPVSDAGQTSWNWVAPKGSALGRWQMVAFGLKSQVTRVIDFTITGPKEDKGQPEGNAFPAVLNQGETTRFYLQGFKPGEVVEFDLVDPRGQRRSSGVLKVNYYATAEGRVDGTWQPLADTQLGVWQIVGAGQTSGVVRSLKITVVTPGGAGNNTSVSPKVGRRGMTFLFSASGFSSGEEVSVWLNAPGGRVLPAEVDDLYTVRGDLVARWSWRAPDDAPYGVWEMVAQGRTSGFQAVIPFTIAP